MNNTISFKRTSASISSVVQKHNLATMNQVSKASSSSNLNIDSFKDKMSYVNNLFINDNDNHRYSRSTNGLDFNQINHKHNHVQYNSSNEITGLHKLQRECAPSRYQLDFKISALIVGLLIITGGVCLLI